MYAVGREIERKFLVASDAWRKGAKGELLCQGYLSRDPERTVRVRLAGKRAWLTIKGAGKLSRAEYEYAIPVADARQLLLLCEPALIEKQRYRVRYQGYLFEVDEFLGDNAGLVIAEVELRREDEEPPRPPWLGAEVTQEARYTNASLSRRPYAKWRHGRRAGARARRRA